MGRCGRPVRRFGIGIQARLAVGLAVVVFAASPVSHAENLEGDIANDPGYAKSRDACEILPLSDRVHMGDSLIKAGEHLEFGPRHSRRGARIDYLKAAALGSIWAERRLSSLYESGDHDVPRNDKLSIAWNLKAAEAGDYYAQSNLALDYSRGFRVAQDDAQADHWNRKAAEQGESGAFDELLEIWLPFRSTPPTPEGIARAKAMGLYDSPWKPKDFAKADALSRAAADAGAPYAQYILAVRYRDGLHVAVDKPRAEYWFKKAAKQNFAPAQYALAEMSPDDESPEALDLYAKAANQGVQAAQTDLDMLYETDEHAPKDPVAALVWYKRGAAYGDPFAQLNLGRRYEKGVGTARDYGEAERWYRKAAEESNSDAAEALGHLYAHRRGTDAAPVKAYFWFAVAAVENAYDPYAKEAFNTPDLISLGRKLPRSQRLKLRKLALHCLDTHPQGRQSPPWPAICCNHCSIPPARRLEFY